MSRYRYALLLATAVLLASNVRLIAGRAVPRWDAGSFYAPAQMLVADAARAGRWLLWNPWISGGSPAAAEPQVGAFSPINTGLGLLCGGYLWGFVVYWLVIWWLGAAGIVLLARHLRAPAWGAAVVAVGYVTSGFYVGHAQHTSFLVPFSLLPFMIWRLDVAWRSGRLPAAAQAGALWGLSALGGYPAMTILAGGFMALWIAGRAASGRSPGRAAVALLVVFAVGCVVLAPAYFAFFFEGRGYTDRVGGLPREVAVASNALHPGALATFASPYVAVLDLIDEDLWPGTVSSSASLYLPAAVLVLAVVALLHRPRPWRVYLAVLAALALAAALGPWLPLRGWLYDLLPPMRFFRHAVIFRGFYLFPIAVLALMATRDLEDAGPSSWRRFSTTGFVAAGVAALALLATGLWADTSRSHFFAACGVALVLWLAGALAARWGSSRRTAAIWLLLLLVSLDGAAALRLSRYFVVAWDEAELDAWRRTEAAHESRLDLLDGGRVRQVRSPYGTDLDNRNVVAKEAVFESYDTLTSSFYRGWLQEPVLTAAVTGEGRFYFTPEVVEVPWTDDAFRAFARRSRELGAMPIVVHARDAVPEGPPAMIDALLPAQPARVELERYEPDAIELVVDAPQAGALLVADRFARGWRAEVAGAAAEVLPADFLFRAVRVPAGTSRVAMSYRPAGHPWLVIVSWGTLAAVALLSALQRGRSIRSTPSSMR